MNFRRIILGDLAIAALAVVLWSPIVGLTPFDPNILRAALAVTSYVAIPAAAVAVNRPLLGIGTQKALPRAVDPEVRGDDDGRGDELYATLCKQSKLKHVGPYAGDAARQVDAARRKRRQIVDMLSMGKLAPGSLAWSRFVSGIDEAESTIRKNAALVSSVCTSFDGSDFATLSSAVNTGSYHNDGISDSIQEQRLQIYRETISRLHSVIENNERLLLELDRFAAEVSLQDMAPSDESSERMLTEMRVLVDEAKRYQ